MLAFSDNKAAQYFSAWLYFNDYEDKSLFQNSVTVRLHSHGDRVVILEEALRRRGRVVKDDVVDDY